MKFTKNGVTIEMSKDNIKEGFIISTDNGTDSVKMSNWAYLQLIKYFHEPLVTKEWHFELFDLIEDVKNSRWFCKKCKVQDPIKRKNKVKNIYVYCQKCGAKLTDIFNYQNKIYEEGDNNMKCPDLSSTGNDEINEQIDEMELKVSIGYRAWTEEQRNKDKDEFRMYLTNIREYIKKQDEHIDQLRGESQ